MSTTLVNGGFPGHDFSANACIDGVWGGGNADWSFCHTNTEANPWLSVQLVAGASVSSVVIYGRSDCCQHDLGHYEVWVSSSPGNPTTINLQTTFALWHPFHLRFISMDTSSVRRSPVVADGLLPNIWIWEQFTAVDGGDGTIGLWSVSHERFVTMGPDGNPVIYPSAVSPDASLPNAWALERFRVVD